MNATLMVAHRHPWPPTGWSGRRQRATPTTCGCRTTPTTSAPSQMPSTNPMWISDGVWVRSVATASPARTTWNPNGERTNYVYVRVRNPRCCRRAAAQNGTLEAVMSEDVELAVVAGALG